MQPATPRTATITYRIRGVSEYIMSTASMMPNNNLLAALCYSADGSETDTIIIDGKIVMQNRELKTIDEEQVYAQIRRMCERLGL